MLTGPQSTPHPRPVSPLAPPMPDSARRVANLLPTPDPRHYTPHPNLARPQSFSTPTPNGYENISRTTSIGVAVGSASISQGINGGGITYGLSVNGGIASLGMSAEFNGSLLPNRVCVTSGSEAIAGGLGATGSTGLCVDKTGVVATVSVGPAVAAGGALGGTKIGLTYSVEVNREVKLLDFQQMLNTPAYRTYFDTPQYWSR